MAENGQCLLNTLIKTSLFTVNNHIRLTIYILALMSKDSYSCMTWVDKVGTYYVS